MCVYVYISACVCVRVCVRERVRESELYVHYFFEGGRAKISLYACLKWDEKKLLKFSQTFFLKNELFRDLAKTRNFKFFHIENLKKTK